MFLFQCHEFVCGPLRMLWSLCNCEVPDTAVAVCHRAECHVVRLYPGADDIRSADRLCLSSVGAGRWLADVSWWNGQLSAVRHRPAASTNVRRFVRHSVHPADLRRPPVPGHQASKVQHRQRTAVQMRRGGGCWRRREGLADCRRTDAARDQ